MATLNMSAPWIIYYKKLDAFFKEDPDVTVLYDEEKNEVKLYINDSEKYTALSELLPVEKEFGNVTLKTTLIPANGASFRVGSSISTIQAALKNNPIVNRIEIVGGLFGYELNYVLFRNCVVQYFTDNLRDYHGYSSTLYEDIARDIFNDYVGVFFCTDTKENNIFSTTSRSLSCVMQNNI